MNIPQINRRLRYAYSDEKDLLFGLKFRLENYPFLPACLSCPRDCKQTDAPGLRFECFVRPAAI
jgi:hypothetical protein